MKFKEEFLKELERRLKENIDLIESSFAISGKELVKSKLYNIELIECHMPILIEDNPYLFLSKLGYVVVNRQEIKVSNTNIACELLLELVNLILAEFKMERIGRIGE